METFTLRYDADCVATKMGDTFLGGALLCPFCSVFPELLGIQALNIISLGRHKMAAQESTVCSFIWDTL